MDFPIFKDEALERQACGAIALDEVRALLDRFSTLVRESGTPDEEAAGVYIVERLKALGVPVTLHTPDLFISLPERSELRIASGSGNRMITSRPPSFAQPTGGEEVEGELVYVPSRYAGGTFDLFDTPEAARAEVRGVDPVAGRIVLTEGFSMPGPVQAFERRGAIGQIYIHPGDRIHEGICTSIWGAPTAESIARKPRTPVVSISHSDGDWLASLASNGGARAALRTWLREGWMRCLLPVAEIRGREDPDEFLLVHGHYDSWYVGIGDNATGDATLLELARVLHNMRRDLKRSVRIAWWPGHSTGRYAGSTWYADTFADELDEWCIAQLDIDSPGCAGATAYEEVMWMAEAGAVCTASIADAVGQPAGRMRPLRAGDYSFNQIGPTGLYMLLSNIPIEERKARGYYAVGGCGGNTAWHTPDDLMAVSDLEIVRRDLRVYLTTIVRILNAPIYPFDYTAAIDEIAANVEQYQAAAKGDVDLRLLLQDLQDLRHELGEGRTKAEDHVRVSPENTAERRRINAVLRRLARILVPINYARGERFDHDPATKFPPVPRLEAAAYITKASGEMKPFVRVGLIRELNKLRAMLRAARRELQSGA
jgi:N-acetylated-alpha-linked acidic dipeptidase